ncbi:C10 family peptidase [Bacteroides stercorirosoris]|uniref:Leucine rich repeat-containing protein n=1 Tax=Bacteroides stercorirosoris TaxID=871324 RepID=A0A1M6GWV2_9BACE|nr:C10 family peptidase [Bacteroides stercorirosoris]SHJ14451.1 Leucine rich repeat-containing protein [Bacteroides stercorirosoris]
MLKQFFKMLLLLVCASVPCNIHAKVLTPEEAAKIATDFFSAGNVSRLSNIDALQLVRTSKKSDGTPVYYVFNAKNGRGFIIISADDKAIPVVGYSYDSSFVTDNVSDVTITVLNNAVKPVKSNSVEIRKRVNTRTSSTKLIKTPEWSQEAPFNAQIPNHRLVGCVGTAMATVMKYHNHPSKGNGSLDGTNFNVQYAWNNMRTDNYRSGYSADEAEAVSTLMAHCAVSIKTNFGMSGSSAFEVRVPAALISYFGYDPGVSYKKRSETDRTTWDAIIVNEINENRPVIYSGQDMSVGHAFVCDGYEMRGSVPYFHINWGWGGSANGYFSSDALNPTVSTSHSFNDQTTIIYNIKPAESSASWSPVHITSDERQIGMTSDVTDIDAGTKFTVRAGAFKNVSYENFSGKIAVALFSSDGKLKQLLNSGKGLTLQSMQIMTPRLYSDFECSVPAGTDIAADDIIRMVTMSGNGSTEWLPVTGDLITINEIKAKNNIIPYFSIDIPSSVDGALISDADSKVIKGRDYSFKVVATSPDKVVTVKANGFILTPVSENIYTISNVTSDQQIRIIVQAAEDVVNKRNLWVTAGELGNLISETDAGTIKELALYGTIDVRDFTFIRERMKLTTLDISNVNIVANGSNPANAIPTKAFSGYGSLQRIELPKNLSTLKNGCFNATGLRKIEIPASVSNYEYNIFLNCSHLSEVIVRRQSPAWVNWCVFTGTPKSKLVVPIGAATAYRSKENWQDFKNIVEENPISPSSYMVALQETEGVKITPDSDNLEVAAGSAFSFTIETDNRFGDAKMEVYANTTKLSAEANGHYTATINANTLIHANFIYPTPTIGESSWKLTNSRGGVGLATDVINVIAGKSFAIRANALAIPKDDAAMFYAAVLTDASGAIKEFISPVFNNSSTNYGDLPCTFNCLVKETSVREGNLVRIATSYNKKNWRLVKGDNVKDSIKAIGNEVIYHKVTMPSTVQGATIQGAIDQIVHGMDFSCKIMPVSVADAITVSVNGKIVADRVGVAQIKVESVREDLDIAIQVVSAGDETYTALNIHAGELASKVSASAFPSRLKLMGEMNAEDFKVLQDNASRLVALDLTDVTIKSYPTPNSLPSMAFASSSSALAALTTILLPKNLECIEADAFYRCVKVQEITIPENVSYIGSNAFAMCVNLKKIIVLSKTPVNLKSNPFPTNTSGITLEVPQGTESDYAASAYWQDLSNQASKVYYNIQIDQNRAFQYNQSEPLTKIEGPGNSTKTVMLGLPNFQPTSYKKNPVHRPGVAFKLYDNKKDVTSMLDPLSSSDIFYPGGYYKVKFYGNVTDPQSLNYPQNHIIDVVFYYNIKITDTSGKAKISFVDLDESNVWRNAEMNKFVEGSSLRPTLFKEGGSYKFTVVSESPNMTPVVKKGSEVVYPDENGIYIITDLQSDVEMDVTMTLAENENAALEAEEILHIGEEEAAQITELNLSGEMTDETFSYIRDNFTSLENLNLSGTENNDIPSGAFAGMENLAHIVIPENITSIGKNAFEGCSQLQSLSLNSVNVIGDGAFKGCTSLTSITLYGNSQTSKTRALTTGINDNSFEGINPNCIIYLAKGLESQISSKSNIVLNGDNKCEALTDIILTDSYAFNIPASFNLGQKNISLSVKLNYLSQDGSKDWKGIVLPFTPTQMVDGKGNKYTIGDSGNHTVSVLSFNENGEKLENQASIEANKPYMIHLNGKPDETVDFTFSTSSVSGTRTADASLMFDVPITPETETILKAGKHFCLYGNYTPIHADTDMYIPDADGYSFNRITDEDIKLTIAPFSVYAKANSPEAGNSFEIGNADTTTGLGKNFYKGHELRLYKDGTNLVIISNEKRDIKIFTVSGMYVTSMTLNPGSNTISLNPGIYIVDGIKVML